MICFYTHGLSGCSSAAGAAFTNPPRPVLFHATQGIRALRYARVHPSVTYDCDKFTLSYMQA